MNTVSKTLNDIFFVNPKVTTENINVWALFLLSLVTALKISFLAFQTELSNFTPDSWSYYELSKTFNINGFYEFSTFRSFVSDRFSASFPFGYPLIIFTFNSIFGFNPANQVIINLIFMYLTIILIFAHWIASKSDISTNLLLVGLLILNPHYIDELVSGRSIPMAVFFISLASFCLLENKIKLGAFFTGIVILTRFDILLVTVAALNLKLASKYLNFWAKEFSISKIFCANFIVLITVSPWIIYSISNFDSVWFSDNSWVAKSAYKSHVMSFPAYAGETLFNNFYLWQNRIEYNFFRYIDALKIYLMTVPLTLVFIALFFSEVRWKNLLSLGGGFAMATVAVLPVALTGYLEQRYLVIPFFILGTYITYFRGANFLGNTGIVILTAITFYFNNQYITQLTQKAISFDSDKVYSTVLEYSECIDVQPDIVRFFIGVPFSSFAYGAITGEKTGNFPRNWGTMTDDEKAEFFNFVGDHILLTNKEIMDECVKLNN